MSYADFQTIIYAWIALALLLFPIQFWRITAPYGRHINQEWGFLMDNRLGWVVMELVSPITFAWFFITGENEKNLPLWIFFSLWLLHYMNRSIIYPLRTKTTGKKIPVLIVLSAIFFNSVNGWSNGFYLGTVAEPYPANWITSPYFLFGIIIFFTGAIINIKSDNYLLGLRKPGEKKYAIPRGGFFNYISCPNHFGEILEWTGFAILTWNIAAAAFAIWTAANLIPRAHSHHQWYLKNFPDYPQDRKAVIPFIL
ncbi:MAG: DUF1295 domain-containing protein [Bacteroidota bacterium]